MRYVWHFMFKKKEPTREKGQQSSHYGIPEFFYTHTQRESFDVKIGYLVLKFRVCYIILQCWS